MFYSFVSFTCNLSISACSSPSIDPFKHHLMLPSPIGPQHLFQNVQQSFNVQQPFLAWIKPQILRHFNTLVGKHLNQIPFQADQKHIATKVEKEWETVWEVFPESSSNPRELVTSPPSSPSITQATISSTTQTSILTNIRNITTPPTSHPPTINSTPQATSTTPTPPHFLQQLEKI